MTTLLDANVLISLAVVDHVHHEVVEPWFTQLEGSFASCPVTQGALVRLILRNGGSVSQAMRVLHSITSQPAHEFWPDDISYDDIILTGVIGHRQVTDAYLAALARHHGGQLATLDRGLAALHHEIAELIDT